MAAISAILMVYNEETRIEATLRCASWCDEIIVLDKQSTDRTQQIARRFTDKVLEIPFSKFEPNQVQIGLDNASNEWILFLVASDLMHPMLVVQIRELIERQDFPYDVIYVPYRRYVLGLETKRSPWYSKLHPVIARKEVVKIRNDKVHGSLSFDTKRHYKMHNSHEYCMYHLTHETVDSMIERHLLYWHAEGCLFSPNSSLIKPVLANIKACYRIFIKRKSFLMGWDGIALGAAYLSYLLLRFVYIWEHRRMSKAPEKYQRIKSTILQAWDEADI